MNNRKYKKFQQHIYKKTKYISYPDQEILDLLEPYGQEVKRRVRQSVGRTNVLLRGDRLTCRMKECNLGNFLADASLNYFIEQPTEKGWNFVAVALWNSGGIRSSIDERMNQGERTIGDRLYSKESLRLLFGH